MYNKILLVAFLIMVIVFISTKQVHEGFVAYDEKLVELEKLLREVFPAETRSVEFKAASKSYTVNKKHINICMRDREGNYYDDQVLLNVMLHELSHAINKDDIGHTTKFYKTFNDLLNKASEKGIYEKSTKIPENYCT